MYCPPAGATARRKKRRRVSPAVTSPPSPPPRGASPGHSAAAGRKSAHKPAKELGPNDYYFRVKTSFCRRALRLCKGAPLSVLNCLWGHVNKHRLAWPSIETIMRQTGYSRGVVCNAIAELERLGLIAKRPRHNQSTEYEHPCLRLVRVRSRPMPLRGTGGPVHFLNFQEDRVRKVNVHFPDPKINPEDQKKSFILSCLIFS